MIGDLHCHTNLSDGSLDFVDLISIAQKSGIDYLAITDHDCVEGIERSKNIQIDGGPKIISGVEISAFDYKNKKKIHILCYEPLYPERLREICEKTVASRKNAAEFLISKIVKIYPITAEQIKKYSKNSKCVFKQHIMHALADAGFCSKIFDDLFYDLFSSKSPNRIFCPVEYPNVFDVLENIRYAKGISVIAHAGGYDNFDILQDLICAGLDGIEVWHPRNSEQQRKYLFELAERKRLLKTGGTDFHGLYSARTLPLGTYYTPENCLMQLINYKL